jgi:hypothetical protein
LDQLDALSHCESAAPVQVSVQPVSVAKVKTSAAEVAETPPEVVTEMSTELADADGLTAVICDALETVNDGDGTEPNHTPDAPLSPEPLIVTSEPPVTGPDVGETDVTDGRTR